jgi:hypothetical protein
MSKIVTPSLGNPTPRSGKATRATPRSGKAISSLPFLLFLLLTCTSVQSTGPSTPAPVAPLRVEITEERGSGERRRIDDEALSLIGRLVEVGLVGGEGRLRLVVEEADRRVTLLVDWASSEVPLLGWLDRPVRLEARSRALGRDLRVTDDESGRLLLLLASRRFPERFPSDPRGWDWPEDIPLSRRATRSQIRSLADEYECFRLSFHYPLWMKDAAPARSLIPGVWATLSWRGASYRLLNRDTWWVRRHSCPGGMGAGATFVAYLSGEPEDPEDPEDQDSAELSERLRAER